MESKKTDPPADLQRDTSKKANPPNATLKYSRKERRIREKLTNNIQGAFSRIAEGYIGQVLSSGVGYEGEEHTQLYEVWDNKWRAYCRVIINKYPRIYHNYKTRGELLEQFTHFVVRFTSMNLAEKKPPAMGPKNPEEKVQRVTKLLKDMGISTQAKTFKGLARALERVDEKYHDTLGYSEAKKVIHSVL